MLVSGVPLSDDMEDVEADSEAGSARDEHTIGTRGSTQSLRQTQEADVASSNDGETKST